MSKRILEMLAVTAELTGTQFSEAAARVLMHDLSAYPEHQVLNALNRCRKELKGRLTLADVLTRIDDGRPGPEEAWSLMPRDEAASVVWTDEMTQAWGVALPLLNEGDHVAARMAFLEAYKRLVQQARDEGVPPHWTPSLGTDAAGREPVLLEAMRKGRLPYEHVHSLLPPPATPEGAALFSQLQKHALEYNKGVPAEA